MFKSLGAVLIIAGTAIGAGMLALPLEATTIGFIPTILSMILLSVITIYASHLTTELFIMYPESKTLPDLAYKILGNTGYIIATISIVLLHWSLLSSYTAGASALLASHSKDIFVTALFFTLIFSALIYIHFCYADYVNRFFFILKIIAFLFLIYTLTPQVSTNNLFNNQQITNINIPTIAVLFTAFGFHGSIPVIIDYLGHNKTTLKKIFTFGTLLPLLIYTLWLTIGFGNTPQPSGNLKEFLTQLSQDPQIHNVAFWFSLFAIITSYLGVGLAQFHIFKNYMKNKHTAYCLTFFIPLLFIYFFPNSFLHALHYAALALSTFAIILPTIMVIKTKGFNLGRLLLLVFGFSIVFFST